MSFRTTPLLSDLCCLALDSVCAAAGHAWSAATSKMSFFTTLCATGPAGHPSSTEVCPSNLVAHSRAPAVHLKSWQEYSNARREQTAFQQQQSVAGYYSRVMALRHLLLQFLGRGKANQPLQVLSLGAGYDTTYFQLEVRAKTLCGGERVLSWQVVLRLQSRARTPLRC